ncbi:MAG: SPOR domain-containing protein [Holosporaceae bacterium]|jgi:cell division protein FtsN|nr:SPOR domain-containing protein [Holosporaceae bacterium]
MSPFLEEDDDDYNNDYSFESDQRLNSIGTDRSFRANFFKDEKKFFFIGGMASVLAFCFVAYFLYSGSKPVDLDDLPIIKADPNPIKMKPKSNEQVNHQDKVVYDNIAGIKRDDVAEKTAPPPEEILSIPEMDTEESLSQKEKDNIIQAFDNLAPPTREKNYKINYVKTSDSATANNSSAEIPEEEVKINADTINSTSTRLDLEEDSSAEHHKNTEATKGKEKPAHAEKQNRNPTTDLAATNGNIPARKALHGAKPNKGAVNTLENEDKSTMIQVASVHSKTAAEAEYRRILNKNKFLKGLGKKILKIDLGEKKGMRYRIQIGPLKNKTEAKKIISVLKSNGLSPYITK